MVPVLPSESIGKTGGKRKNGWVTHSGDGSFSSCTPVQDSPRVQSRMLHRIAFGEGNTDWWCAWPGTLAGLAFWVGDWIWVVVWGVVGIALRVYYLSLTHLELNSFCRFVSSLGGFRGYETFHLHPSIDQ